MVLDGKLQRRGGLAVPVAGHILQYIMSRCKAKGGASLSQAVLDPASVVVTILITEVEAVVEGPRATRQLHDAATAAVAVAVAHPTLIAVIGGPARRDAGVLIELLRQVQRLCCRQGDSRGGRGRFAIVVGSHHLNRMCAGLGPRQRGLVGFGRTGGQQRGAIVELDLADRAVRVVGGGGNGDVGERRRTLRCHAVIDQSCLRRGDADAGLRTVQRVVAAEVPHLLTRVHLWLLAHPVAFARQLQKLHLDTVITWCPCMHLGIKAVVVVDGLGRRGTAVVAYPDVQGRLHAAEDAHVVARSVDVEDRQRTHAGVGRRSTHGIAADRHEGGNEVRNLVHGVVGEHTTHGEATEIDAVAVDLILGGHLVDERLDEVDVAVAANVPLVVDAIREEDDELGGVAHGLDTDLPLWVLRVAELGVQHVVGILSRAMTEDKQRAVLAQVFRCIDQVRPALSANRDVVGLHRRQSCYQQQEQG